MYCHLIKSVFRNIARDPWFPAITLAGLTFAFACTFIALIYVFNELSYDKHHKNRDRIYKVIQYNENLATYFATSPHILYTTIKEEVPHIEKAAISRSIPLWIPDREGKPVRQTNSVYANSEIFEILSFDLIHGDRHNILSAPDQLVLSRSAASRHFSGKENPVGSHLTAIVNDREEVFVISGVFEDWPELSTFRFDYICHPSLGIDEFRRTSHPRIEYDWRHNLFSLFVLLNHDACCQETENTLNSLQSLIETGYPISYSMHSMKNFYFDSDHIGNWRYKKGNRSGIFLLSGIAALILFIAVSNSILFLLARFSTRTREIGIRKVTGAGRWDVIKMPLVEAVVMSSGAFLLAVMMIELFLPQINVYFSNNLHYHTLGNYEYILVFAFISLSLAFITGLAGGSRFSAAGPARLLRGNYSKFSGRRYNAGKFLLIMQIAILIGMVSGSAVIIKQLDHLVNADTGIDKEKILKIRLEREHSASYQPLKEQISNLPGVESVSGATASPPSAIMFTMWEFVRPEDPDNTGIIYSIAGDYGFFETFGIGLAEGRFFSEEFPSDRESAIVLNRTAVRELNLDDPVGSQWRGRTIIGVSDDFLIRSLHDPVLPVAVMCLNEQNVMEVIVRFETDRLGHVVEGINSIWRELSLSGTPAISHPEEIISSLYREENNLKRLISRLTLIASFIAVSGLSGLAVFTARRRTKEIGIRKVNGATTSDIFILWSFEYMRLVLLALLVSTPPVYYIMSKWLESYPQRVSPDWWIFILAGVVAAIIVWISTAIQTYRAVNRNPVNLLRYE